ncbi:Leucine-rich_repeat domain superfamily [Hexamita inflata]|uniref:Leucine-rich repeat domain superfamily n=1 Tax=Hexamita inflata TaxID=28002 RepID=A0AA86TA79_9EUKA|nr:Leucine-rich repeat domain superfamily [Hexamita inflata]
MTSSQLIKWQEINSINEFDSLGQSNHQIREENLALILTQLNLIPTNVTHLTINNCDLTSIQDISEINKLIELDLSYNRIKDHISELGALTKLKILNIQNNKIFRIDEWLLDDDWREKINFSLQTSQTTRSYFANRLKI